jgi:hypothetical protein
MNPEEQGLRASYIADISRYLAGGPTKEQMTLLLDTIVNKFRVNVSSNQKEHYVMSQAFTTEQLGVLLNILTGKT